MCFFYALSREAQKLENRLGVKLTFDFKPVYYTAGFDYPKMPVVTDAEPDRLQLLNWGLVPAWTKPENADKMRSYTLNARRDTLFVKPSFREAVRKRRCLVPATGFYEWRAVGGKKYPYFIYLKGREIFNFAGLWEEWVDPQGEVHRTYTIITTEANSLVAAIHNVKKRMPGILATENEREWLRPGLNQEEIMALTRPLDSSLMEAHTIGPLITARAQERNVPEIQAAVDYPGLPGIYGTAGNM